jgi:putative addiction module component (TIGR02574 family)
MSAAQILEQIRNLPEAERREVVERIQDEYLDFDEDLTPEQIAELERRAARARAHPEHCRPMEEVFADIEKRYRVKQ